MGLSFSVSQSIQLVADTGQMLTNNNSEIINYHYSIYTCNNESVVSFQPVELEPPYERYLNSFSLR